MAQIKIKRVYVPAEPSDGFRILVDRLWPRGVRKDALSYDLWDKDTAPSPSLRQWFHQDTRARWEDFRKRYLAELTASAAAKALAAKINGRETATLLYAARDEMHNHAQILKDYLESIPE